MPTTGERQRGLVDGGRHRQAGLFLVEIRSLPPSTDGAAAEAVEMHTALRRAVARLAASGTAIGWCAAWLLPDEGRCLCLVRADREADVLLARDLAALSGASVSSARALDGDRPVAVSRPSPTGSEP
ncbi:hypothetical protein SAMN05660359_01697 [Geodermatophilus obscurus]|uniref:DUF4242 domain-containing protein n=1 Tax=Geodermatophilus obscurus TaxID=1861 RepID=A0A1I5ERA0_9ACTN|nr:hypothetical protein SAMN05660359_01697 [Geodermatophilus obscurus]